MRDRLATIDMGRKVGGVTVPLSVGELGSNLTQCGLCCSEESSEVLDYM